MRLRELLGCLGQIALITVVGVVFGALLIVFVSDYLKLPEWTRWVFQALATALITAGVGATVRQFVQQSLPADSSIPDKSALSEEDQKLVQSIQLELLLLMGLAGVGVGLVGIVVLPAVQQWIYARSAETTFFVAADPLWAFIPLMLLGVIGAGLLAEPIARHTAGERWLAVRNVVYEPLGYELSKRLGWLWLALMGLFLLPVLLWFDNYARFTEQGVSMNRFWSLRERFYAHSQVEAINEFTRQRNARTGAIERYDSPYYEVRLRDGAVFRTAHLRHRYDDTARQLMRWWSEKSGVPIREATLGVR